MSGVPGRRSPRLVRQEPYPLFAGVPEHPWERGAYNPSVLYDAEKKLFLCVYRGASNDGTKRQFGPGKYYSSVGGATSADGKEFARLALPLISPDRDYENALGCEDPSLQKLDADENAEPIYCLLYTAVGGLGSGEIKVRIALATSQDFVDWKKHGVVGPPVPSKNAVIFPKRIGGKIVMLYTRDPDSPKSCIRLAYFDSVQELENPAQGYWDEDSGRQGNHVLGPSGVVRRGPETGPSPIKTKDGWLLVFCAENRTDHDQWDITAALLDFGNPASVLAVLDEPLLTAEREVDNGPICRQCVFPKGAVIVGDQLYVYHGTGDNGCALSTCPVEDVLAALRLKITPSRHL